MLAAYAAAMSGATTLLIDKNGFVGGTNTAAGVCGIGGWQYDLDGSPLIAGLSMQVMKGIADRGGADPKQVARLSHPREEGPDYRDGGLGCYWIGTNPEYVKVAMEEMLLNAGVELLYHTVLSDPIMDNNSVLGVFIQNKSGYQAVLADVTIDCTGDGDIAARAGADFSIGRPEDNAFQPMSTIYWIANAKSPQLNYNIEHPDSEPDPLLSNRCKGAIELARRRGDITHNPNDVMCSADPVDKDSPDAVRRVNFTRVQKHSAIDADELTRAEIQGRKQVLEAVTFQRNYIPGCENAFLVATSSHIGIRESRRIRGDYTLTSEDVLNGAAFDDTIMRGIYLLDIHNPTEAGKPSTLRMLDQPYSIPYRCLVPKYISQLLVAGRCISGDHIALASYRVQSHCMALGEAAGVAAALCCKHNVEPRLLDIQKLQHALRANGSNVGDCS